MLKHKYQFRMANEISTRLTPSSSYEFFLKKSVLDIKSHQYFSFQHSSEHLLQIDIFCWKNKIKLIHEIIAYDF